MPVKYKNWDDMMQGITNVDGKKSSYHFKNFYFMDEMLTPHGYDPDIPSYLHMLQHIYRTPYTTGQVKSIHRADDLVALGCHEAQKCFKGKQNYSYPFCSILLLLVMYQIYFTTRQKVL